MLTFDESVKKISDLKFLIGETEEGDLVLGDLDEITHLLVSGATGSGKSVFVDSLLLSLLSNNSPNNLRFVLCDTKILELQKYNSISHMLIPVSTDTKRISNVLSWCLFEGMRRLQMFSKNGSKHISRFNDTLWENFEEELSRIVIVLDDLAEIVRSCPEAEHMIMKILSIGRATGIYMIAVTQSPSVKKVRNITFAFYSRVVFQSSPSDVRFLTGKSSVPQIKDVGYCAYCHGSIMKTAHVIPPSQDDFQSVIDRYKETPRYCKDAIEKIEDTIQPIKETFQPIEEEEDELFPAAVEIVLQAKYASPSLLQRKLKLGYSRAARLVDQMEAKELVGPFQGSKPREVLITKNEGNEMNPKPEKEDEPLITEDETITKDPEEDNSIKDFEEDKPIIEIQEDEEPDDSSDAIPDPKNKPDFQRIEKNSYYENRPSNLLKSISVIAFIIAVLSILLGLLVSTMQALFG